MSTDNVTKNGIEITSSSNIAVVCSYKVDECTNPVGYLAMPAHLLGTKYVVATGDVNGYFGIISENDGTVVNITFSTNVTYNEIEYKKGENLPVILDKLETLTIAVENGDLSGTIVEANRDIAVISASLASVAEDEHDNNTFLMAFLIPQRRWSYLWYFMTGKRQYTVGIFVHEAQNVKIYYDFTEHYFKHVSRTEFVKHLINKTDAPNKIGCSSYCQLEQYQ